MLGSLWFNSFSSGAGPSADYELISTTVLGSSAASVTFSGLGTSAAAYKHLQIRLTARSDNSGGQSAYVRLNGDSGTNYAMHTLEGNGSAVYSGASTSQTSALMFIGGLPGNNSTSGIFEAAIFDLLDFSSTSKNKTMRVLDGTIGNVVSNIRLNSGLWMSTSAVTSISISPQVNNFVAGARFSLYGLKG